MEKIYKYIRNINIIVLLFLITGCTDNEIEPIFDQSVNERTAALKAEYLKALTAPENGWIGYYTPSEDFGVYTMLMDFDNNGSVKINSDYQQGNQDNTITYRLDKTLKIELVLESFAVFHEIFSINNNNNDGEFVFNILSATENEVVLESKTDYGNDITIFTLRKALPDDLDIDQIYLSEDLLIGAEPNSGLRNILLNNVEIGKFSFSPNDRTATITYLDENQEEVIVIARIVITGSGFYFFDPVSINGTDLNIFTPNSNSGYTDTVNNVLVIDDFLLCPFDITSFVGTYAANEDGYCNGCYQVVITQGESENTLVIANLYEVGGTTEVTLSPDGFPSTNFSFGEYLYTSSSYGDGFTYNPSAVTGDVNDNISSFSTCDNYMDLYFRVCFDVGCFPVVHIQLTKL